MIDTNPASEESFEAGMGESVTPGHFPKLGYGHVPSWAYEGDQNGSLTMALAKDELKLKLEAIRREVDELFKARDLTARRELDKDQRCRYLGLIALELRLMTVLAPT